MKNILLIGLMLLFSEAYSQTWAEKLAKKAAERTEERAKQKVEDKVNDKVDKTVDDAFDGAENAIKSSGDTEENGETKSKNSDSDSQPKGKVKPQDQQSAEMVYAKSDFVPGDEVMFEDNVVGEKLGEFPSMWDLISGNAEVASLNGQPVICILDNGTIAPLMKNMKAYLPEAFTVELDVFFPAIGKIDGWSRMRFTNAEDSDVITLEWYRDDEAGIEMEQYWITPNGESRSGRSSKFAIERNTWHHFSISFNKRAFKLYLDGVRIVNIPNCGQPVKFLYSGASGAVPEYIRNIRIAQGAVPLYDRLMSDGKFISYGITFDVGKSTIKPESMGEINRIVTLMNENPTLKFSVEGHTDATGNATSNQTLSEARSKAVVEKLTAMGIDSKRLASAGKGQSSPIADNSTDEGRAKNRRVEFVKK